MDLKLDFRHFLKQCKGERGTSWGRRIFLEHFGAGDSPTPGRGKPAIVADRRQNSPEETAGTFLAWQFLQKLKSFAELPSRRLLFVNISRGTPPMSPVVSALQKSRMTWLERTGVCVFLAGITSVFLLASRLTPDPSGMGTHRQLGFPECVFLKSLGRPCPHCGMTTAFAWIVRGEFRQAWRSNPSSLFLAVALVVLWPWSFLGAVSGRWPFTDEPGKWFLRGYIAWMILAVVIWAWRW